MEDMDLAVRASLKGWKFVFVGDLKVLLLYFLFSDDMYRAFYARVSPLLVFGRHHLHQGLL